MVSVDWTGGLYSQVVSVNRSIYIAFLDAGNLLLFVWV